MIASLPTFSATLYLRPGSVALSDFQEKIFNKINGRLIDKLLNATEPSRCPQANTRVNWCSPHWS